MISSVLAANIKLYSVLLTAFSFDQVLQSRGSTYGACYLGGGILSLAEHEAVQTCLIFWYYLPQYTGITLMLCQCAQSEDWLCT